MLSIVARVVSGCDEAPFDCEKPVGSSACNWLEERLETCGDIKSGVYGTVWLSSIESTPGTGSRCITTPMDGQRGLGSAIVFASRADTGEVVASSPAVEGAFSINLAPGRYLLRLDFEHNPTLPVEILEGERQHIEFVVGGFGNFADRVFHPRLDSSRSECKLADGNDSNVYPQVSCRSRTAATLQSCLTFSTGIYGLVDFSYLNSAAQCPGQHTFYARDGFARIVAVRESDGSRWLATIVDGVFAVSLPPGRYYLSMDTRFWGDYQRGTEPVLLDLQAGKQVGYKGRINGGYGQVYAYLDPLE